jgi:hypothetical protein
MMTKQQTPKHLYVQAMSFAGASGKPQLIRHWLQVKSFVHWQKHAMQEQHV